MDIIAVAVKTSLILSLGLLAALACRRRSAAVRHWVIAVALLCASTAPLVSGLTPSWSMPAQSAPRAAGDAIVNVSFGPIATPGAPAANPPAAPQPSRSRVGFFVGAVVAPLWLLGVAVNLLVLALGMFRLTRLRAAQQIVAPAITNALTHVAAMFELRRPVTLACSTGPAVMVTWGVLDPKIVLPADAGTWPRERLDVVLGHEIAHITRGDWLVQTVAEVCKAVYWFNPLFWIACARLRHESERACDDAVMRMGVESHVYANELLEIARSFGRYRQVWLPAPAMAARPSNLERRVRAMLNARLDRGPLTRAGRWGTALALLAITLPIATFAQGGFVTFSGTIVDPQDRVLPDATVTVSDALRNVKHETKTDRNGRFELVGLPAGDYTIEMQLPGFSTLHDVGAINSESVDRTWRMQVGSLQETIRVVSDDGAITDSRQSGTAYAKPPNPVCGSEAVSGPGGNIRPPRKVKDVRPGYPGVDGRVQLAATIGVDGSVVDTQVVSADAPPLAAAAIDAVRQWEFSSTLLNCLPIEVHMNVSVSFSKKQ